MNKDIKNNIHKISTYFVWAVSWLSVFISLYYSNIQGLAPCELCWWQRILIYPLAILSTVAIVRKDFKNFAYYVLPLAGIGAVISFYHSLLQWGIVKVEVTSCSATGISCADPEYIFWFVTIPFGAFLAFTAIAIASSLSIYFSKKTK